MKRIKWFQRSMIVLLLSINVLFYCIKIDLAPAFTIGYTFSAALISVLSIFIYKQSGKRRLAKVSMAKSKELIDED